MCDNQHRRNQVLGRQFLRRPRGWDHHSQQHARGGQPLDRDEGRVHSDSWLWGLRYVRERLRLLLGTIIHGHHDVRDCDQRLRAHRLRRRQDRRCYRRHLRPHVRDSRQRLDELLGGQHVRSVGRWLVQFGNPVQWVHRRERQHPGPRQPEHRPHRHRYVCRGRRDLRNPRRLLAAVLGPTVRRVRRNHRLHSEPAYDGLLPRCRCGLL